MGIEGIGDQGGTQVVETEKIEPGVGELGKAVSDSEQLMKVPGESGELDEAQRKTGRPTKAGRKTGSTGQTGSTGETGRTGKSGGRAKTGKKAGRRRKSGGTGKGGGTGKSGGTGKVEGTGKPEGTGRAGKPGTGRKAGRPRKILEEDSEIREAEVEGVGQSCQEQLDALIVLGKSLDDITPEPRWDKTDDGQVLWKPTQRDGWIRDWLKIRPKEGKPIRFELNAVQREYARVCLERNSKQNIVLKARQLGITSYIAARFFVQTIMRPGTLTMLVAHNREAAQEIFRIVHRFWVNLPERLKDGPLKTSHSSARELVFPLLDSEYTVTSADENAGRGRTIQNLHCTEVSRWSREAEEALAALRAAVVPDGEVVLESTANGAWGPFYKEWQQAEETGFTRHFFPWWFEKSYEAEIGPALLLYNTEERSLVNDHGLNPKQIAWRRQQWARLRTLAGQEFAEDAVACFRASGECVFELNIVEAAMATAVANPTESRDNGRLAIWLPAQPGKRYVIGVDPAGGGVDGDYSCAEVIERDTGMQCAELHGHFPQRELSHRLVKLGAEYNWAMLAVERNNHGNGVLAHLENAEYPQIFVQNKQMGWNTTAATRPKMIETFSDVLAEQPELFRSEKLWNECRTFVRHTDGTTAAAPGTHDDCVFAMGIALAVRSVLAGQKKPSAVRDQSLVVGR